MAAQPATRDRVAKVIQRDIIMHFPIDEKRVVIATGNRSSPRLSSGRPALLRACLNARSNMLPQCGVRRSRHGFETKRFWKGNDLCLDGLLRPRRPQRQHLVIRCRCGQDECHRAGRRGLCLGLFYRIIVVTFAPAIPECQSGDENGDHGQDFAQRDPAAADGGRLDGARFGILIDLDPTVGIGSRRIIAHGVLAPCRTRGVKRSHSPNIARFQRPLESDDNAGIPCRAFANAGQYSDRPMTRLLSSCDGGKLPCPCASPRWNSMRRAVARSGHEHQSSHHRRPSVCTILRRHGRSRAQWACSNSTDCDPVSGPSPNPPLSISKSDTTGSADHRSIELMLATQRKAVGAAIAVRYVGRAADDRVNQLPGFEMLQGLAGG